MTRPKKIRLGTRASQLALWQSNWVREQLQLLGAAVEVIQIRTDGDAQTGPLSQIGGQGLFTKQLQIALLNHEIDLAVHSLKDLPTDDHAALMIAAIPLRENRADVLVAHQPMAFQDLPAGAKIGTGSIRRSAQLLHLRRDIVIADIRGNIDTRLKKLAAGEYDGLVLAAAGLIRLGWAERISYEFPTTEMLPAVGQGALGLETRRADNDTIRWVSQLNHAPSYFSAMSERAMLNRLFAGCLSPVGADSRINGEELSLTGIVLSRDGRHQVTATKTDRLELAVQLGVSVAEDLLKQGAGQFLAREPQ